MVNSWLAQGIRPKIKALFPEGGTLEGGRLTSHNEWWNMFGREEKWRMMMGMRIGRKKVVKKKRRVRTFGVKRLKDFCWMVHVL